jgi:hypothetical protein
MKLELTNPKAWSKISERNLPMESKLKVYEKVGGAYRLGRNGGEQVYNTLSELIKDVISETSYKKTKKTVSYKTMGELKPTTATADYDVEEPVSEEEGADHEVGMSMNLLDDIIKNATELKGKIGTEEFDMPGWVQDHISQSQNFINQANTGYHELKTK